MKFAEHLSAHITPEWRKQYINYEVCKTQGAKFFQHLWKNNILVDFSWRWRKIDNRTHKESK